jgi:hypothetical protein
LLERGLEPLLQILDLALDPFPLGFRETLEDLRRDHLALGDRREGEAHGRAQERDVVGLTVGLDLLDGFFLALFEFLLDHLAPVAVFVAFEGRGQGVLHFLHETGHVVAKGSTAAGRQAQRAGLAPFLEVADVTPVGRRWPVLCRVFQKPPHHRVLARALRPQGIEIVTGLRHADSEVDRLHGPVLSDDLAQILQLTGGLEGEVPGLATPAEGIGGKGFGCRHGRSRAPLGLGLHDGRAVVCHQST